VKIKLSRTSIAILVVAFALAAYGLISSTPDDASADLAVTPRKVRQAPVSSTTVSQQSDATSRAASTDRSDLSARIDELQARTNQAQQIHDLFAVSVPIAPPVPAAPPPPKPSAPAFPYTFIGAMQDGPNRTLYLSRSDRVVIARGGDILDGLYQVDSISARTLTVTYLPLHQQQVVSLGRGR
jgi:hypothetical protein